MTTRELISELVYLARSMWTTGEKKVFLPCDWRFRLRACGVLSVGIGTRFDLVALIGCRGADFPGSTFCGPSNEVRFLRIECNPGTHEENLMRLWVATVKATNPGRYA
jgi:hypothetical protein